MKLAWAGVVQAVIWTVFALVQLMQILVVTIWGLVAAQPIVAPQLSGSAWPEETIRLFWRAQRVGASMFGYSMVAEFVLIPVVVAFLAYLILSRLILRPMPSLVVAVTGGLLVLVGNTYTLFSDQSRVFSSMVRASYEVSIIVPPQAAYQQLTGSLRSWWVGNFAALAMMGIGSGMLWTVWFWLRRARAHPD
ncbi:MAG: hypothetical protein U0556_01615 [Dehalococcoidia bacterium]